MPTNRRAKIILLLKAMVGTTILLVGVWMNFLDNAAMHGNYLPSILSVLGLTFIWSAWRDAICPSGKLEADRAISEKPKATTRLGLLIDRYW